MHSLSPTCLELCHLTSGRFLWKGVHILLSHASRLPLTWPTKSVSSRIEPNGVPFSFNHSMGANSDIWKAGRWTRALDGCSKSRSVGALSGTKAVSNQCLQCRSHSLEDQYAFFVLLATAAQRGSRGDYTCLAALKLGLRDRWQEENLYRTSSC